MKVHAATLAGGNNNADRFFVTDHAAIVLDGATAFEPVEIDPGTYAATLGSIIVEQLDNDPRADLLHIVAVAIGRTAKHLQLTPDRSPSSTVSIMRVRPDAVDMYVLGDSPIYYGKPWPIQCLTDDRLAKVAAAEREHYLSRLRAGYGYNNVHRAALVALQRAQGAARNTEGGYWISEADPSAAAHGMVRTVQRDQITWAVIATDGAAEFIEGARNGYDWHSLAHQDSGQLAQFLAQIHRWEATLDPDGRNQPRAKRHDDKTIVAISMI